MKHVPLCATPQSGYSSLVCSDVYLLIFQLWLQQVRIPGKLAILWHLWKLDNKIKQRSDGDWDELPNCSPFWMTLSVGFQHRWAFDETQTPMIGLGAKLPVMPIYTCYRAYRLHFPESWNRVLMIIGHGISSILLLQFRTLLRTTATKWVIRKHVSKISSNQSSTISQLHNCNRQPCGNLNLTQVHETKHQSGLVWVGARAPEQDFPLYQLCHLDWVTVCQSTGPGRISNLTAEPLPVDLVDRSHCAAHRCVSIW